eukprot:scaffold803_cov310-Pinguiococcus_pyrenoidosus.AAC.187
MTCQGLEHAFATKGDEQMCVIAFHPDSDFGPQDECHPMINRTIINGRSAAADAADAFEPQPIPKERSR